MANKTTAYDVITDRIIRKMEEGIIPWVKPWKVSGAVVDGGLNKTLAYSYSTGKPYNFINQFLLDYEPGEYATFNQIKKAGGHVKKGSKGQIVAGWIVDEKVKVVKDENGDPVLDENGDPKTVKERHFGVKYDTVFNVLTQVEGLNPKHNWTTEAPVEDSDDSGNQPDQAAEDIVQRYINSSNAPVLQIVKGSDRAYYRPSEDKVVVPHMTQYESISEYYSTMFHELTHSTGIASRLNRKVDGHAAFGSGDYSREELVAEIGACFLCDSCGLSTENSFRNSVAYLQSWIAALKKDSKMIVFASAQAEKATEYILNAN